MSSIVLKLQNMEELEFKDLKNNVVDNLDIGKALVKEIGQEFLDIPFLFESILLSAEYKFRDRLIQLVSLSGATKEFALFRKMIASCDFESLKSEEQKNAAIDFCVSSLNQSVRYILMNCGDRPFDLDNEVQFWINKLESLGAKDSSCAVLKNAIIDYFQMSCPVNNQTDMDRVEQVLKNLIFLCLKNGMQINEQDRKRNTFLHYAVHAKFIKVVQFLIDAGASISIQNKREKTPLHVAAGCNSVEAIKLLVDLGASISVQGNNGTTPLHVAASCNFVEATKLLVDLGASISAQDNEGKTPLHIAAQENHIEALKLLVDLGASISAQDNEGKTPLHIAAQENHIEAIKLLVNFGASISAQTNEGHTPLHYAAKGNHVDAAEWLIHLGASLSVRTTVSGFTPLQLAAFANSCNVIRLLIASGAKLYERSSTGKTALHIAAQKGHFEAVHTLLAHGADPFTVDDPILIAGVLVGSGCTPRQLAVDAQIIELLKAEEDMVKRGITRGDES